jgi:hypothetical protein
MKLIKTILLVALSLFLVICPGCAPKTSPETGAPPLPEDYKYVEGTFEHLLCNNQTILFIETTQGQVMQFIITQDTKFEIDGDPCGITILSRHQGWRVFVNYWESTSEADRVDVSSPEGWVWEATLIVEASIIPGPPQAPQKGKLKVTVIETLFQTPVAGAAITLNREETPAQGGPGGIIPPQGGVIILGNTNDDGELVRDLDPEWHGTYLVKAKKGGYNPGQTEINIP